MMNLYNKKKREVKKEFNTKHRSDNFLWKSRYYPSSNREWTNSIYSYYTNNKILLPNLDEISSRIIKSYFNMYSTYLKERLNMLPIIKRKKTLETSKFWISKGTIKHTNDKVIINLFIYNQQYNDLIATLKSDKIIPSKHHKNTLKYFIKFLKKNFIELYDRMNYILLNKFKTPIKKFEFINYELKKTKALFNVKAYVKNICLTYIKNFFNKEVLYYKYKQMILFNKLKFTNNLLLPLKILLTKVYNKKIEFNIITLKYYFFNSEIMSQILVTKLRNRKNRVAKVLKSCVSDITLPVLNNISIIRESNKVVGIYNETISRFLINNLNDKKNNIDVVNKFLNKNYKLDNYKYISSNSKQNAVLDNVKHKVLSGIRIRGSGRLTKRITASRTIHKLNFTGKLKDLNSSYKGLSSTMLRGYSKSNIQYSLLGSKTRIGAFGLKSWIGGY